MNPDVAAMLRSIYIQLAAAGVVILAIGMAIGYYLKVRKK